MFREGRHIEKKTSAAVKKCIVFFVDFSLFSRGKSMENRAKSVKTVFVHKNRQKITFGTTLFSNNSIFNGFLGIPWVARGSLGHPGNVPKSSIFPIYGQFRVKTGLDGPPEGSRQSPGVPRAPKGYHCKSIV